MGWWPSPIGRQCQKVWAKPWLWLRWPRLLRRLIVFKPLINIPPFSKNHMELWLITSYNFHKVKLRYHAQVLSSENLRIPLHSTTTCSVLVAIQYMDVMSSNLSPVYLTGVAQGPAPLARAMHGCAHLLPARSSKVGMQASAMVLATVHCTKK